MDTKSKKSENKTFAERITSKWLQAAAMITACITTGLFALQIVLITENQVNEINNYDYTRSDEYRTGVYEMYERLCILSAVYLSNVDENWNYQGSEHLLSDFLYYLDYNKYEYRKTDEGIIPVSDMFNYYVSFTQNKKRDTKVSENLKETESKTEKESKNSTENNSSADSKSENNENKKSPEEKVIYITNIDYPEVPDNAGEETRLSIYKQNFKNYIVRRHDQVTSNEISSGNIKTYSYPTKDSAYEADDELNYMYDDYYGDIYIADYNEEGWTQETYADNLLPLGGWYYDNYGRYIYNFGNSDPILLFDFDKYSSNGMKIRSGYVEIKENTDKYRKGDVCSVALAPDYQSFKGNTYDITVFISPKDSIVAEKSAAYVQKVDAVKKTRILLAVFGIIDFICIAYLTCVYGYKKPAEDGESCWRKTPFIGKIYTELYLLAIILILGTAAILLNFFCNSFYDGTLKNDTGEKIITSALMSLLFAAGMISFLEIINKIKTKSFFKDCFIIKISKKLITFVSQKLKSSRLYNIYLSRPAGERISICSYIIIAVMGAAALIALISILLYNFSTLILAGTIGLAAAVFGELKTIKSCCEFDKVSRKIDCLADNQKSDEEISEDSVFYPELCKLNKISDTVKNSVEQQIKSERMKIELVANVSHDLKTPLTSIISYIDLLKKLNLNDEAAAYVQILDKKSQKLKNIVADVFSLAKATSGIEVELNKIDFVMLLSQVLADMADKIEASEKILKINMSESSAMIMGDGNKLYRVFQNLIDNMINYSMQGTRLFIDIYREEENIVFTARNVSETPIDYTADEITERFVRGDKSRTDGGSGLGLSIAKSFTEACGGTFDIELDGDMFKSIVKMPVIKDEQKKTKIKNQNKTKNL